MSCEILVAKRDLDDYTRQRIESIRRAVMKMESLVEAFLALARGEDTPSETATLEAIVQSELPTWQQLAEQKRNRFLLRQEVEIPAPKGIEYPAVLLRTVIDNLIRNAVHHTAGGEIVLVLKADSFEARATGSVLP